MNENHSQILKMSKREEPPIVSELIDYIKQQGDMIQKLKDELAELKGQKPRPQIKPSNLEKSQTEEKHTKKKAWIQKEIKKPDAWDHEDK